MLIDPLLETQPALTVPGLTVEDHSIEIEIVDPLVDKTWDRQVSSHPYGSIFHTSLWARVLAQTYGHTPRYVRFSCGGKLAALFALLEVRSWLTGRRGVAAPFADQCEPLWFQSAAAAEIMNKIIDLAQEFRWRYLELRGALPASVAPLDASVCFASHHLSLVEEEAQFSQLSSATRRAVRKGIDRGVTVECLTSPSAIKAYYQLHVETRQKHGSPPQPFSFFRNLGANLIAAGAGFVALAYHQQQPVAGAVFLHFGRKAVYKFGAQSEARLSLRGSNMAIWAGLLHLRSLGCDSLNFGRTSLANEGLRRFKKGWGSKETSLSYYRLSPETRQSLPTPDRASTGMAKFFKTFPPCINRVFGALLYPHLE